MKRSKALMLLLALALTSTPLYSQTQTLTIGGDVYGGGKNGAVGTGNTTATNATAKESVTLTDATTDVTEVTINSGKIRTVFGGGENGRVYGKTNVNITGTTTQIGGDIDGKDWTGTIYGGVFGAGDGAGAYVFGGSNVTVTNGSIMQNVYGGGNQADLMGSTQVLLQGGDFQGNVFAGARMANIFGYSYVNIDGANALNDIIINSVYGGNDISGTAQASDTWAWTRASALTLPFTPKVSAITSAYNAFVQATPTATGKHVYVGQIFGGGNGDYAYDETGGEGNWKVTLSTGEADNTETTDVDESHSTFTDLSLPTVDKVYLELAGGTYGYAYGGGNKATVVQNTDICIDNADAITPAGMVAGAVVDDSRLSDMGINLTTFTNDYQFIRMFGGNNLATMDIRPTWHMMQGSINNLYSGGNKGDMTNKDGILLTLQQPNMTINNVYGGCRMANVDPEGKTGTGIDVAEETIDTKYKFLANYSAKVLVTAGRIYNVYGGNDVSGNVYGGSQLEIHSSIIGDVYGGGNGSYPYTDNASLETDKMYGDFYYEIPAGKTSAQALNMHRPNVENTWVHIAGNSESDPTYIGGAVYCGGNSATLRKIGGDLDDTSISAHLQFGSYVIANSMFLGSNGENMVRGMVTELTQNASTLAWESNDIPILQKYAEASPDFSQMDLTDPATFDEYMCGVEVAIKPTVSFDEGYAGYSTKVGSLYCGGNVGSMSADGYFNVDFLNSLVIFEKLVGGCNNANVAKGTYNAFHEGGLTSPNTPTKVTITIDGLKLEPRILTYDASSNTYTFDWNKTSENMFIGGNIYGGCYKSGYINGGVTINLKADAISDVAKAIADGTNVRELEVHRDSVLNTALSIFGAGYGEDSEIWGNTVVNISDAANIVKVFGGGEMGVVGNLERDADGIRTGNIEAAVSTEINLLAGNADKIYGGGFEGPVTGHTTVNLVGGTAYDVIGGACNADIEEYAETYVGEVDASTIPVITNNIYGANDFGGKIKDTKSFASKVRTEVAGMVYNNDLLTAAAYIEYTKGKAKYIFGGAKAAYDYTNQTYYSEYTNASGEPIGAFVKPAIGNAFVNFRPENDDNSAVARVYGAGQGYYNERDKDALQDNSYVLIDIPSGIENFAQLEVFGAGDYSGVGMTIPAATVRTNEATDGDVTAAAVIDLARGNINSVYGGSYKQGFTRRTIVNVPAGSTIDMSYLYGGAYGVASADGHTLGNLFPCDVYESNVNFSSSTARCRTIYGGNNSYRRTLYTHVNINAPVQYVHAKYGLTHANIFGAGYGKDTWAQYTEVNLNDHAKVYEPYGGGEAGSVYNKQSTEAFAAANGWSLEIPGYTTTDASYDHGGLDNALAHTTQLYADYGTSNPNINVSTNGKYNSNVHIYKGAEVVNYAYGAGLGAHVAPSVVSSGTTAVVSGTSYIDLLGGIVNKDLYAAGTTGAVQDTLGLKSFTASSTAYIKGGMARNVYGGGWDGPVGRHNSSTTAITDDVLGETNVIIGRPDADIAAGYTEAHALDPTLDEDEYYFYNGVPAITRNAYAAGEGGVVHGTANLNIYNGLIGYRYKHKDNITVSEKNYYRIETENGDIKYVTMDADDDLTGEDYFYVEEIDQDNVGDNIMYDAGNAFGGGYAVNSDVDIANITLWNGIIRNSMYGGGEIATIGRGVINETSPGSGEYTADIYKPGETHVTMWGGHVLRDVFGGGRGFNNWKTEDKSEGNTNGFIFGKTDVNIHYGTIGTREGVAKGYGNVFGGGNIGFVYSQYTKQADGWYYEDYSSSPKKPSEDTRVEVKVYGKALEPVTIAGTSYSKGAFIPNTELDKLTGDDSDKPTWAKVDQTGVVIYNAVFAGGNVSAGSDKIMAFSKTVFGNSTASVVDIYGRDLISIGGSGVGGLYGDGNLTFVDGYRELNITNYGTDYYSLQGTLDETGFNELTPRQQSFYITRYECQKAHEAYEVGDVILTDIYNTLDDEYKTTEYWKPGQSIINEGRYINTVQRCDFCGIKGSRLVLHGAIDRAQDEAEADYTNYTINRVGELSLNQSHQTGQVSHGCYFGIYNVVKFLGGVTSDVRFAGSSGAVRETTSTGSDFVADGTTTYYQWKQNHLNENNRNDGTSPNKIALASGVFLEIVKDLDVSGNKVYGPITGVVELDLLNVSAGEGGGYVYAENIHGVPTYTATYADVISDANHNLVTNRAFEYATATDADEMQTSGNFVHAQPKRILDDCFPDSKSYVGTGASPAHYWYIRGEFYVYEQLVSAYTGGADAYNTEMSIPLTMSIQGNAKLRLLNVIPGLYADPANLPLRSYNADDPTLSVSDSISIVNNAIVKTYGQGDPISYWDWYNASNAERAMFVRDADVMVCKTQFTLGSKTYYPGEAINISEYNTIKDQTGKDVFDTDVTASDMFCAANEVSKGNGYVLTVDLSNPSKWDDYYRHLIDQTGDPIKKAQYLEAYNALSPTEQEEFIKQYVKSATFKCKEGESGTYGQYYFHRDDVISHNVYAMETGVTGHVETETQAKFEEAYILVNDYEVTLAGGERKTYTKGTSIPESVYDAITNSDKEDNIKPAYICVSTVLVAPGDYRVLNQLVPETDYNGWTTEVQGKFQPAYYCMKDGSWGGKYYEENHNYNAIDYGQLLPEERSHFTYNYDALDLLLYSDYVDHHPGNSYAFDDYADYIEFVNSVGGTNHNNAISVFDKTGTTFYSGYAHLDYTATFNSDDSDDQFTYVKDGASTAVSKGVALTNDEYESLPNDRQYYASFAVSDTHLSDKDGNTWSDANYHTFIVKNTFDVAGTMYNAGKSITHAVFSSLGTQQQANVQEVIIPYAKGSGTYYFCTETYTVGVNDGNVSMGTDETSAVSDISGNTYSVGADVPLGTIIDYAAMTGIPNYQLNFDITGEIPVEETTLYVPVSADINALQRDRYVTAIYEYTYTESNAAGTEFETRIEKHIVNIRIKFLSGTPVIGKLKEPELVLPLETVGLDIPTIQEGAFPILGGGWEIYPTEEYAKRHRNGREYVNGGEPLYFYQNDHYVAYYALTRMGKSFSDPVPVHVANYQRMADVITDPNHMYINHRDNDRDPKIYIDSRSSDTNGNSITLNSTTYANELDALQGVWSLVNGDFGTEYSTEVDGQSRTITGAENLEFFLQSEVATALPTWTPLGDDTHCFEGIFHGNGNTITGLSNSLFGKLCGRVYNLGVMGSFTAGGIANTGEGRIENAWVWSAGTPSGQAVYANPAADARVINAYYPDVNTGFTGSTGNIEVTERTVEEFVNGAVTYDLNRYYLEARYRLNGSKTDGTVNDKLFFRLPDGTLVQDTEADQINDANGKKPGDTGYIPTYPNMEYTINYADADYARFDKLGTGGKVGYVEKYFDDGDFRFSDGRKPLKADMRLSATSGYLPIYPDDYIFFGQKLTYDILNDAGGNPIAHATHPQAVAKSHTTGSGEDVDNSKHGLLVNDVTDRSENRVYRAPAYFRNGTYSANNYAMFNANAVFVDNYNNAVLSSTVYPHHNMTAIDFTGGNGDTHGYQGVVAGLASDFTDRANGYHPLLDYERLDRILTSGITHNLLAYTPKADIAGSKTAQTNEVLTNYFHDPAYAETNTAYRNVAVQNTSTIHGHLVQQATATIASGASDYEYQSLVDHLLVDRHDFNAPMPYTFAANKRMWYQRHPDNYAQGTAGWEGVSLPFQTELVTTQDKGEITHFYTDSEVGHEYWLREYKGKLSEDADKVTAKMEYPATGSNTKNYTNTFLYEYYYSQDGFHDLNNPDQYQQQYYSSAHEMENYPYSVAGRPYIAGFPGSKYYEFDLSGNFEPLHRINNETIVNPGAQTITFASPVGTTIAKSDAEISGGAVSADGYIFTPTYLNLETAAGSYVLNSDGSSYDVTTDVTAVAAFRPYFTKSSGAKARRIVFGNTPTDVGDVDEKAHKGNKGDGDLIIYAERGQIVVESTLADATEVRITTASGIQLKQFTIEQGQTVATPVTSHGVYIVNNRKLLVR